MKLVYVLAVIFSVSCTSEPELENEPERIIPEIITKHYSIKKSNSANYLQIIWWPITLNDFNLKGKVSQFKEVLNTIETGWPDSSLKINKGESSIYSFNSIGNLVNKKTFDIDSNLKENYRYIYDSQNMLIRILAQGEKGKIEMDCNYRYDQSNQLIEENSNFNYFKQHYIYAYDELNYLIGRNLVDSSGRILEHTHYSYDISGNLDTLSIVDSLCFLKTRDTFKYDNFSRVKQSNHYGEPINCSGRTEWFNSYNFHGDLTQAKTYDLTVNHIYEYDEHNNWTKRKDQYNHESNPNFLTTRIIKYSN